MKIKMKPETIRRRAKERKEAQAKQRADLIERLTAKVNADPDGIWSELLQEIKQS